MLIDQVPVSFCKNWHWQLEQRLHPWKLEDSLFTESGSVRNEIDFEVEMALGMKSTKVGIKYH